MTHYHFWCRLNNRSKGRNTPAQLLDVWSIWRDSDEVGNKYILYVQLCLKLSELRRRCRLRFSMQSLRRRAIGCLSHWILWLVVCQLNGRSDGGILCGRFVFLCTLFCHPPFFMFCSPSAKLVVMSVKDMLICVCLVMPCCMFSMQLLS